MVQSGHATAAKLKRRLFSLIYESLILAAVLLAAALPVVMLTRGWEHGVARITLQVWLFLVCGLFYVWQWARTGQTLPMKTWRMRLIAQDGSPAGARRAVLRYIAACLTLGIGYLWALVDRDGQFLHDRIAGTRLVEHVDSNH
jgi:uncharacterized RDD family membrane protein YckC